MNSTIGRVRGEVASRITAGHRSHDASAFPRAVRQAVHVGVVGAVALLERTRPKVRTLKRTAMNQRGAIIAYLAANSPPPK
jgi:hypothetical protein